MTSSVFTAAFFVWGLLLCAGFAALELMWLRAPLAAAFASRSAFLALTAVNFALLLAGCAAFTAVGGYAFLFVFPIPIFPVAYLFLKVWAYRHLLGYFAPEPAFRHPWVLALVSLLVLPALAHLAYGSFSRINPTRENLELAIRENRPRKLRLMLWLSLRTEPEMTMLVNEAITYGNLGAVRQLTQFGADPLGAYWLNQANAEIQTHLLRWMFASGMLTKEINLSRAPSLAELAAVGGAPDLKYYLEHGLSAADQPRLIHTVIEATEDEADLLAKLRLLQAQGANFKAPGVLGFSPLFIFLATGREQPAVLQYLLEQGVDVNERSAQPLFPSNKPELPAGLTPLMLVADQDRLAAAEILLRNGADRTLRDPGGKSAFDYAPVRNAALRALLTPP